MSAAADKMAEALRLVLDQNWNSTRAETHDLWRRQRAMFKSADQALAAYEAEKAQPARCTYCDGTGDVHDALGVWRGTCTQCNAGKPAQQAVELTATDAMTLAFHRAITDGALDSEGLADIKTGLNAVFSSLALAAGRADAQPAEQPTAREALADVIAAGLSGTWHCTRVWQAWGVGTMSQDDFEPVDESDTPGEIADAILAMLAARAEKGGT